MEKFNIEGNSNFPSIDFNTNGLLNITGAAINFKSLTIFEPIVTYATEIQVDTVKINISLTELNTQTAKHIYMIINELQKNDHVNKVKVNMQFSDDENTFAFGQLILSTFSKTKVEYQPIALLA